MAPEVTTAPQDSYNQSINLGSSFPPSVVSKLNFLPFLLAIKAPSLLLVESRC